MSENKSEIGKYWIKTLVLFVDLAMNFEILNLSQKSQTKTNHRLLDKQIALAPYPISRDQRRVGCVLCMQCSVQSKVKKKKV